MARIRTIKPAFFRSEDVTSLKVACRLTWAGIWTYVDDEGRGADDARLIKADLWPVDETYTSRKVEMDLAALASKEMICRYEIDGRHYLHVVNWQRHQKINHPQASRIPPCTFPDHSRNGHVTVPELSIQEGNGREVEVERNGMEVSHRLTFTQDGGT